MRRFRREALLLAVLAVLAACQRAPATVVEPRSGMELVLVHAGQFAMGSPVSESGHRSDEASHRVTISRDFYLGRQEVTQRQWQKVMGTNPSHFRTSIDAPVEQVTGSRWRSSCAG